MRFLSACHSTLHFFSEMRVFWGVCCISQRKGSVIMYFFSLKWDQSGAKRRATLCCATLITRSLMCPFDVTG